LLFQAPTTKSAVLLFVAEALDVIVVTATEEPFLYITQACVVGFIVTTTCTQFPTSPDTKNALVVLNSFAVEPAPSLTPIK